MMPNLKITGSYVSEEPDVNLGDAAFFISELM
jgi:hypothetical protein